MWYVAEWYTGLVDHFKKSSVEVYYPFVRVRLCKLQKGCTRLAAASDNVYQLLAHGRWFSPGSPVSSTTKTGRHDIAEILLKVALSTKDQIKSNHPNDIRVSLIILKSLQLECIKSIAYTLDILLSASLQFDTLAWILYTSFEHQKIIHVIIITRNTIIRNTKIIFKTNFWPYGTQIEHF